MANSNAVKRLLSGSTDGKPILVAATTTPWTTIHTAVAGTTPGVYDEIWIYATNNHTAEVNLTLERWDATATNNINMSIPSKTGLYLVVPWLILQNAATVKAFAGTTNVVHITWWVNSITEA